MNIKLLIRRPLKPLMVLCAALLADDVGVTFVSAQGTNHFASATEKADDASQFPGLDKLPGKVPPHVWSGLSNVWARDHALWKAGASHQTGTVVFLGDSITEGWHTLARDFPNLNVADRGIGGDITSGVLYRLNSDVLSLNPQAIVLLIGTNDFGDGADPEDVAANIRLILLAIRNFNPGIKVIVCKIMPRAERGGQLYAGKIQKANALVEQFVKQEPNCVICDTWSVYADNNENPDPACFNPDRLHLNAAGYLKWKSALDPLIARLNLKPGK
jgi:lysophospholipase L1-like esterase